MADRHLRKTTANKAWMTSFTLPKARNDPPIRDSGDHAYQSGTKNIKAKGRVE